MKKSAFMLLAGAFVLPATAAAAAPGDSSLSSDVNINGAITTASGSGTRASFASDNAAGTSQFKRNVDQFLMSDEKTDGPGYTYAQGEYIPDGTLHGSGHDFKGYGGDISLAFPTGSNLPIHPILQGGWHRLNLDHSRLGLNQSYVGLGGETYYDYSQYSGIKGTGIGFYGTVNYERLMARHVTAQGETNAGPTADGWGITTGLRWMAMPQVEVNPHATYYDFGKFSGDGVNLGSPHGFEYGMQLVGYLDPSHHTALTVGYDRSDMGLYNNDTGKIRNAINVGARFTY